MQSIQSEPTVQLCCAISSVCTLVEPWSVTVYFASGRDVVESLLEKALTLWIALLE